MPSPPRNGKLYYGGGYDGSIPGLSGGNLSALQQGYATVNSDSVATPPPAFS